MKKRGLIALICVMFCITFISVGMFIVNAANELSIDGNSDVNDEAVSDIITEELLEMMENSAGEIIKVYVWLKDINVEEVAASIPATMSQGLGDEVPVESYLRQKRSYYKAAYSEYNCGFIDSVLGLGVSNEGVNLRGSLAETETLFQTIEFVSTYAPMVILNLTSEQIYAMATDSLVVEIGLLHNQAYEEELDIAQDAIQAEYVHTNYGYTGEGVAVGLLELSGVPNQDAIDELSDANIEPREGDPITSTGHSNYVASVIVGKTYGIAPDCTLYAAKCNSFYADIEWLLDNGVSVINCSFGWGGNYSYNEVDRWVDHIDMNHNVLLVKSAGNRDDNKVTSPGLAYNGITVGAYNDGGTIIHTNDTLYTKTGYNEAASIAEKPDLLAPGVNITVPNLGTATGTSLSAPMVTGTVALMIEANPDLCDEPGVLKSILLASAFRKVDADNYGLPTTGAIKSAALSEQEGAGKLDTKNAIYIVNSNRHKYEYLYSYMFPYTTSFYVEASESQIRVALCWLKQNVNNSGINDPSHDEFYLTEERNLSNLDLEIYDPNGNLVGYSRLENGNVELVEFDPTVTGWYTIKVVGATLRTEKDFIYLAWW